MDVLHEDALVLEGVSLGLQVQLVVQVAVDLLGLPGHKYFQDITNPICNKLRLGFVAFDQTDL